LPEEVNVSIAKSSFAVILALASLPLALSGQQLSRGFLEVVDQARQAQDQGRYAESATLLEHALETAPPEPLIHADVRTRLGMAYQDLGRYYEAEKEYRQAAHACRTEGATGQRLLASALNNLGSLYLATGKPSTARETLLEALQAHEATGGGDADLLPVVTHLGEAAVALGDLTGGSDLYLRALEMSRRAFGPQSWKTATALNNLSSARFRERRLDEAADLLVEAIEVFRVSSGENHPTAGRALANLAVLRFEQGRLEDAEAAAEAALETMRGAYPENHPEIAYVLQNYAKVLAKSGRGKQAKQMRRKSKEMLERSREENMLDHTVDVSAFRVRE
jgi:tetratricopeptide (TPR) repeat protein